MTAFGRLQARAETGEVTLGELVQFVVVEIIDEHFSTEARTRSPVDFSGLKTERY